MIIILKLFPCIQLYNCNFLLTSLSDFAELIRTLKLECGIHNKQEHLIEHWNLKNTPVDC